MTPILNTTKVQDHVLVSIEPGGYISFLCSAQPKMELRSYELPRICPVCRHIKPIKMGVLETVDPADMEQYSYEDATPWVTR